MLNSTPIQVPMIKVVDTPVTEPDAKSILRAHGIKQTSQRLEIIKVLHENDGHFTAESVYHRLKASGAHVSKATVYNTLSLFLDHRVIRQVIVHQGKAFYCAKTTPHHHFFDSNTEELTDIELSSMDITGLPELPPGTELDGLDLVVRIKSTVAPESIQ
ncbi:Fur family transcriptional regulator [Pseudomonadota bacterium]